MTNLTVLNGRISWIYGLGLTVINGLGLTVINGLGLTVIDGFDGYSLFQVNYSWILTLISESSLNWSLERH